MSWVNHTGNACPVDGNTLVRVEYRRPGGFVSGGVYLAARLFNWSVTGSAPSDIIRYEVKP